MRLALSTYGFELFKERHSIWPVTLVVYNLSPWMFMNQLYFIMSLLTPGPTFSGNGMDICSRPLTNEFNELWTNDINT